jgi:hypothetical protein
LALSVTKEKSRKKQAKETLFVFLVLSHSTMNRLSITFFLIVVHLIAVTKQSEAKYSKLLYKDGHQYLKDMVLYCDRSSSNSRRCR